LNSHSLAWFVAPVFLAGCAGPNLHGSAGQPAGPVVVKLNATSYNAGEIGQATLHPLNGNTHITLNFSGVPPNTTMPVHVYTYIYEGKCDGLPKEPVYSLNDRVLVTTPGARSGHSSRGPFSLSHSAPLSIEELMSGRFALGLRTAPADGDQLIYCSDVRKSV
jgi:hypothetical protein